MSDPLTLVLRLMTLLVGITCLGATFRSALGSPAYYVNFAGITIISLVVFNTLSGLMFYVNFELSLIPIALIIIG